MATWVLILHGHAGGLCTIPGYPTEEAAQAAGRYACDDIHLRNLSDKDRAESEREDEEKFGVVPMTTEFRTYSVLPAPEPAPPALDFFQVLPMKDG